MQPSHEWFDDFVMTTKDALTQYVRRKAPSREDVHGIVQETYLRAYCALRKSRLDDQCSVGFLYTTARNLAIGRYRHQQVVARTLTRVTVGEELRMSVQSTERKVDDSRKLNALLLLVNTLPPKCRQVFVMRMVDGLSQREIGDRLGISVSTVEKHLARGLRACKDGMDKLHRQGTDCDDAREIGSGT
jgi:RNA polymerase sigma factor (sigma-70 family)